ncbi:MAG: ATP-binding protein [Deltaproteobacteria bacterium]|nr:ATP-binding protein [Deltaproteobacteria bacterium]
MDDLWVAIRRKAGEGILGVRAKEADLQYFRRWVLLQGLTEEWGRRGDLQFITFEGRDGEIWADTDPEKVGKKGEKGVWEPLFRKEEKIDPWMTRKLKGVFEIAKVVRLEQTKPSLLRVGLSTQRVEGIISADRRNILLFSVMLLIFGGVGMTFIYRMESRHLAHVREMEERVHKSEKMSSLAYLAAGVAHEIRNPLNAIGLAIQRLQREFPPQDPEMRKEYDRFTNVLRGEVKRVNEIIEQFLFFARPARLELELLAIKDILEDLFYLCQEAASQQGVALEKDIEPDLPSLRLDRKRIQEALLNLMNNGLQAMPQGGQLRVTAQRHDGREILIRVADTGGGIPAENLTKIFDYYFTTKERGTGLGLPLAHKIIEEHGGSIQVSSEEGKGTVFRVYLPLARDGK